MLGRVRHGARGPQQEADGIASPLRVERGVQCRSRRPGQGPPFRQRPGDVDRIDAAGAGGPCPGDADRHRTNVGPQQPGCGCRAGSRRCHAAQGFGPLLPRSPCRRSRVRRGRARSATRPRPEACPTPEGQGSRRRPSASRWRPERRLSRWERSDLASSPSLGSTEARSGALLAHPVDQHIVHDPADAVNRRPPPAAGWSRVARGAGAIGADAGWPAAEREGSRPQAAVYRAEGPR